VWWNLPRIHTELKLASQKGLPGKWCNHGWPAWTNYIKALALDPAHLRLQLIRKVCAAELSSASRDTSSRFFSHKSASTFALLALLSKWCCADERLHMKTEADRDAVFGLLRGLVEGAFQNRPFQTFVIYGQRDEQWSPPRPPTGSLPIVVECEKGVVELAELMRREHDLADAVGLHAGSTRAPLASLLRASSSAPRCEWLFKQLIWFVGAAVDSHWSKKIDDCDGLNLMDLHWREMEKCLVRYWYSTLRTYEKATTLSVAMDASRMGQKNSVCGIICTADNKAAIFPPQVICLRSVQKYPDFSEALNVYFISMNRVECTLLRSLVGASEKSSRKPCFWGREPLCP